MLHSRSAPGIRGKNVHFNLFPTILLQMYLRLILLFEDGNQVEINLLNEKAAAQVHC